MKQVNLGHYTVPDYLPFTPTLKLNADMPSDTNTH